MQHTKCQTIKKKKITKMCSTLILIAIPFLWMNMCYIQNITINIMNTMKTRKNKLPSLFFISRTTKLHYICEIYVLLYYLMHKSMNY